MRPLLLKGHERSITYVRFNKDGDLLFSCSKDNSPAVWRSSNGERIGTYEGHRGAVFNCDITDDSKLFLTASADNSARLWNAEKGTELFKFDHAGPVKGVAWMEGDCGFATCADNFGEREPASVNFFELADNPSEQSKTPRLTVVDRENPRLKPTRIAWLPLNKYLLIAWEDGSMSLMDPADGAKVRSWRAHHAAVTSITFNAEKSLLVSSSKDNTAKVWDAVTWEHLYTYTSNAPLNAAVLHPTREHVLAGGGQDAMNVTTSSAAEGNFHMRVYHLVFEHELGRLKGHFGPINAMAFNPDGRSFATGGEDGYIRLQHLDEEYDKLGEEEEIDLDDSALGAALADGTLERLEKEEEEAQRKAAAAAAATVAAGK